MKLLKPCWVTHGGKPIFSVDIHPDGKRFATGGQWDDSGKIIIWNMAPVLTEKDEKNKSVPKSLCEMGNHIGCVNSVRWSIDGKWLASGGDDSIVMIWQLRYHTAPTRVFGSDKTTHEHWSCVHLLRGHSGDVLDLCWSHEQHFLASASVDNTIVVWNARKFPDRVATIQQHEGLVKGVTWDPVGKYLASQSDDKSVRVWRTNDWKEEACITSPFSNCGGNTHVLRLDWSPDARYIVTAHALNNDGPTAHIIDRNEWKTGMDFVGHRKAIEVVKFNPNFFKKSGSDHGCIAIGSRDRSVSVWLTHLKRPLVIIHDLFKHTILDLSWSKDGYSLMACSMDSSVVHMKFSEKELGAVLTKQQVNDLFLELYGSSRYGKGAEESLAPVLIESPSMLKLHTQKNQTPEKTETDVVKPQTQSTPPTVPEECTGASVAEKQKVVLTKEGKRRITPVMLSSQPLSDSSGSPFLSASFSSPSQVKETPPKQSTIMETSVKSPPARPISFAPLSPEPVASTEKTQKLPKKNSPSRSLLEARAMISGQKRSTDSKEPSQAPKPKKAKRSKPDTVSTPQKSSSSRALLLQLVLPVATSEPLLAVEVAPLLSVGQGRTIEVANTASVTSLSCRSAGDAKWSSQLSSPALLLSASSEVTCVICQDNSVSLYSTATGRRLLSRFFLKSSPYQLKCNGCYILVATSDALLSVYDSASMKALLHDVAFRHLLEFSGSNVQCDISLTSRGLPVVFTGKGIFTYMSEMKVWSELYSHSESSEVCDSNFSLSRTVVEATPLCSLQRKASLSLPRPNFTPSSCSVGHTLGFLEGQISRSVLLKSPLEYIHWSKAYVRYLVKQEEEGRLREFLTGFMRPSAIGGEILGKSNIVTGRELLEIVASSTKLQRLYCELREVLDHSN